jgi:hypothetical protein
MNYNDKWLKDLKQGEADEKYLASFFTKRHNCSVIDYNPNNDNSYDIRIIMSNKEELLEVKSDRYEEYHPPTGNICLELSCSGKLSGLWTTKSTIYCFYFPIMKVVYMIRTEKLKEFIRDTPGLRRFSNGGDGGKTTGVLINREEYKDIFKIIRLE